jgi:hypothetical protein
MIHTQRVLVSQTGGLLICVINRQASPTTYLTQKENLLSEQLTLTLAFLTTKGIQHIWQINLDYTPKITGVYLM